MKKKRKIVWGVFISTLMTMISATLMIYVHDYFIGLLIISAYFQGFIGHAYAIRGDK